MHLIFDLDGTLGDTLPLCISAFRLALEPRLGRTLRTAEIVAHFGPSEEGTLRALAPESHEEACLADYLAWYRCLHRDFPAPFDGIPALLDRLRRRGAFLGLVTGKGEHSTRITLEQYGLQETFHIVKTGSPDGPIKPQAIAELIAEHGAPKADYLYVGDSPSDITACREAGIAIAAAAWASTAEPEHLHAGNPDYLFETIAEFATFVDQHSPQAGPH